MQTFKGHADPVYAVALSPDGAVALLHASAPVPERYVISAYTAPIAAAGKKI